MKFIKNIYKGLLSSFNYPYISEELLNNLKGPILLHISDTPDDIYNYIFRLINILKPQFVIHTGDLVDNIKLGNNKNLLNSYQKSVEKLIEGLEENEYSKIYYALGNHDDYDTVSHLTKRGVILQDDPFTINDFSFIVSHYHKEYPVEFNLYGHSFEPAHYKQNETIGLNGVLNINIVDLSTKEVFHLDYPIGTNRFRRMETKKIGL